MDPIKLQLSLDEETAQGRYANLCAVSHNNDEFLIDFAFVQPGTTKGKVHSRIILSPRQAKQLQLILAQRVAAFEHSQGEILGGVVPQEVKH